MFYIYIWIQGVLYTHTQLYGKLWPMLLGFWPAFCEGHWYFHKATGGAGSCTPSPLFTSSIQFLLVLDWSISKGDKYQARLCWCLLAPSRYQHIHSAARELPASQGPAWRPAQHFFSKEQWGSLFCCLSTLYIMHTVGAERKRKTYLKS